MEFERVSYEVASGHKRTKTIGGISVIPNNMEKFMSITWNNFRFIDSLQFLDSSLDNLVAAAPGNAFVFTSTLRHHRLLMRKGVYPYEYMNDWDRFDETQLPLKRCSTPA